jgi:hypothetical protein
MQLFFPLLFARERGRHDQTKKRNPKILMFSSGDDLAPLMLGCEGKLLSMAELPVLRTALGGRRGLVRLYGRLSLNVPNNKHDRTITSWQDPNMTDLNNHITLLMVPAAFCTLLKQIIDTELATSSHLSNLVHQPKAIQTGSRLRHSSLYVSSYINGSRPL